MCDPVSIGIATFALGSAQAITSHIGQNQAYKANEQAANYNYARENEAVMRQSVQLDKEQSESAFDTAIAGIRAEGDIVASASDRGLGSSSIAQQLNASMFGLGRQATIEDANFRTQRGNLASSRTDAELRRQSQINSKTKSGALNLALGIGGAGLQGFNAGNAAKKGN